MTTKINLNIVESYLVKKYSFNFYFIFLKKRGYHKNKEIKLKVISSAFGCNDFVDKLIASDSVKCKTKISDF